MMLRLRFRRRLSWPGVSNEAVVIKLIFAEIVEALGGRTLAPPPFLDVRRVSTDSRDTRAGDLFFALRGPNFDGHDFAVSALQQGAVAAVVAQDAEARVAGEMRAKEVDGVLVPVDDPLAGLIRLADFHRRQTSVEVIVVVGSNGKTTTKAMIDHVLQGRLRGRCSPRSFNNEIGVPLTLLSTERQDDYLVVEIGTNAPGEVADLTALVQPDLAVITSIGEEHLEGLGDLRGVAREECSVLQQLKPGGFAAVNIDWPDTRDYLPATGATLVTFGRSGAADLRVTDVAFEAPWLSFRINAQFPYRLRLPGTFNACNAAGAATIARRLGFEHEEIAERLASFDPLPMRSNVREIGGVHVIDDTYNANPASMRAAIELLEAHPCSGKRVLVLGEMRELGDQAALLHRRLAEQVRGSRLDVAILVGGVADHVHGVLAEKSLFGPTVRVVRDTDECAALLVEVLVPQDVVLLKGSRAVGLDAVVETLAARSTSGSVA